MEMKDDGQGKSNKIIIEYSEEYLSSLKKKYNFRGVFGMIVRALKSVCLQKEYKAQYVLSEPVINELLEKIESSSSKKACRNVLKKYAEWLKKKKRIKEEYEFPKIKIGKTENTIKEERGYNYLKSFNLYNHVSCRNMQFACLLVKTYGFWSCQLLELMRSNFYKEKKEDVLLNKSQMLLGFVKKTRKKRRCIVDTLKIYGKEGEMLIKLTPEIVDFIKAYPEVIKKKKYIFSKKNRKTTVKSLNRWLKESLTEKYNQITFQLLKNIKQNGSIEQSEFNF
jgi:hypothetical protein